MEIISGVHDVDFGVVHAYLVAERDRLTLIDSGLATHAARILDEIEAIGRRPKDLKQIVVTHYHVDHSGGATELVERTGASLFAHALDAPVLRGETPEPLPVFESDLERETHARIVSDIPPFTPVQVDTELLEGDELDIEGGATVVHVPGHTPGSIAVYLPQRRALFVGDAAVRVPQGQLIVGVFNASPPEARRSFAKLAALDFDVALFGHGAPMDRDACLEFRRVTEELTR